MVNTDLVVQRCRIAAFALEADEIDDIGELEADMFARELLAPQELILQKQGTLIKQSVAKLAEAFVVTKDIIIAQQRSIRQERKSHQTLLLEAEARRE
jgi:Zn-dependent peptidase ImmA (M78 family)